VVKRAAFFPGLAKEVELTIRGCLNCQRKDNSKKNQKGIARSVISGYPFQRLHVDYVGPMNPSRRSQAKWILTARCSFSKWVEAFPMKSSTAQETANVLIKEIFSRYGPPESIHTDRGPQFCSELFHAVGKAYGVKITHTPAYNPKSNAQVERFHRDLGLRLRALNPSDPWAWEDALPHVLLASRTNPCAPTGLAPYQILFGREPNLPLDLLFGNPHQGHQGLDPEKAEFQYVARLKDQLQAIHQMVRTNLRRAVLRQRRAYHHEVKNFLPGAKVWLFTPKVLPGTSRKLQSYWSGPWIVAGNPVYEVLLRIVPDPSWTHIKKTQQVSIDRLKPFIEGRDQPVAPEHDDLEMEEDMFAEAIEPSDSDSEEEEPRKKPKKKPPPPPGGGGGGPPWGGPPPAGGGGGVDPAPDLPDPAQPEEPAPPGPPGGGEAPAGPPLSPASSQTTEDNEAGREGNSPNLTDHSSSGDDLPGNVDDHDESTELAGPPTPPASELGGPGTPSAPRRPPPQTRYQEGASRELHFNVAPGPSRGATRETRGQTQSRPARSRGRPRGSRARGTATTQLERDRQARTPPNPGERRSRRETRQPPYLRDYLTGSPEGDEEKPRDREES